MVGGGERASRNLQIITILLSGSCGRGFQNQVIFLLRNIWTARQVKCLPINFIGEALLLRSPVMASCDVDII